MDLKHRHTIHHNHETAQDLFTLETDLRKLLEENLDQRDQIQALNLACGRADETGALAKIISEKAPAGHIEGLDLRIPEISHANELWKTELAQENSPISCNFRVGHGNKLNHWKELDDQDLVFVRHQNFWFDNNAWIELYNQALHKLKEDGVMVITSYFDQEHEMARQVLTRLGAIEVAHRFNPHASVVQDSPKVTKTVDRHISIFKK